MKPPEKDLLQRFFELYIAESQEVIRGLKAEKEVFRQIVHDLCVLSHQRRQLKGPAYLKLIERAEQALSGPEIKSPELPPGATPQSSTTR